MEICLVGVSAGGVKADVGSKREGSAVVSKGNKGIGAAFGYLHADGETLDGSMYAVIICRHSFLLVFRKEVGKVSHIHKSHVKLVRVL